VLIEDIKYRTLRESNVLNVSTVLIVLCISVNQSIGL
jgi:hypothetical protein